MLDFDPSPLRSSTSPGPGPGPSPTDEPPAAGHSTQVKSAVCDAMNTCLMQIECGFTRGFTGLTLIGNSSDVCRDGKERARAALEGLGIHIPPRRLVVSLTPADVKMDGNHFDLPVAVSLALLLVEREPRVDARTWLFAAELGLSGELRPVRGVVSFAVAALAAGLAGVVVAPENLPEVAVLAALDPDRPRSVAAMGFRTLRDVLGWIYDGDAAGQVPGPVGAGPAARSGRRGPDFDDMILHPGLELAAVTAGAGLHSLLLRGSPGTGKSMLAARLASILPNMTRSEHIEAMRIHSAGMERLPEALLAGRPPFRAPHHQASAAAIMGGPEAPGELALAHGGVLFLDELPEFRRDLLEALREPLETGEIRVARARRKVVWKARVVLVAACNNCPCGWDGSPRKRCDCDRQKINAYRHRLSGPLLDRIDLHVNVPEPGAPSADLFLRLAATDRQSQTAAMLARVERARAVAAGRNGSFGVVFNRDLAAVHLVAASGLAPPAFAALVNRVVPRSASSRSVLRCLRVARTLADLRGSHEIREEDVRQAWAWQAEAAAKERGEDPTP